MTNSTHVNIFKTSTYQSASFIKAVGGFDEDTHAEEILISNFRAAGIELVVHRVLSLLTYSAGMLDVPLVVLYGSMAQPEVCEELRARGYSGYILILLKNPNSQVHKFFDADANDVTFLDSPIDLTLRLLAAKNSISRHALASTPSTELKDQNDRLQSILDTHLDFMSRYLPGGMLSFVNDAICHNYAMKREEMIGQCIVDFVPPEDRADLAAKIENCFKNEIPFISRQKAVDKCGRVQWTEWYNIPVLNQAGKVVECQGVGRDITESVLLAERLKTKQEHLRMALTASNTVTWALNLITLTMQTSENCLSVLGFAPKTLNHALDCVIDEDKSRALQFIEEASKKAGENILQLRVRNPQNGEVRWYKVRCSALQDAAGKFNRLCGVCFDITDRMIEEHKQTEKGKHQEELIKQRTSELASAYERLHASERFASTGMVAAQIVHELNGPIAGIRNAFFLIRDGIDPSHKYFDYMSMIENELDRLIEILRQLFVLYGPEGRKKTSINVRALLEESCKMMTVIFARKLSPIRIEASSEITEMVIAPRPLQQVFYNVLINALKASPKEQPIHISIIQNSTTITVSVHNGGEHIAENIQASLFEPFCRTRAESAESGLGLGLGLGLYLSRCLMSEIGGSIAVESKANFGTRVMITIPKFQNG